MNGSRGMRQTLSAASLMFFLLLPGASPAQMLRGQISGQLRFTDHSPVEFAVVRLRSEMYAFHSETSTDRQGRFLFGSLLLTTYILEVEFPDHQPYTSHIDLTVSRSSMEDITLRRLPSKEAPVVPPEGPNAELNARLAQVTPEAKKEYEAGRASMGSGDFIAATLHFKEASRLFPNYAEAYQLQAVSAMENGNLQDAESLLHRAVTIEPRLSTAHFALGICYNLQGAYSNAQAALRRGLDLDPASFDGNREMARTEFVMDHFAAAERYATSALKSKPDAADVYIILGYSQLRQQRGDAAVQAFRKYVQLNPAGSTAAEIQNVIKAVQEHATSVPAVSH
jgi:tetratricopeptide (TPR) repeat protein